MCVRQLHLTTTMAGQHFVQCTCQGCKREGVPCSCFFWVSDDAWVMRVEIVGLGMVDARYLRMYNSCYNEDSPNGKLMHKAQREYLENENMGTMVSGSTLEKLIGDDDAEYPILGRGATAQDFNEARYVMSTNPVTTLDL